MLLEELSKQGQILLSMSGFSIIDSFVEGDYEFYLAYNRFMDFYEIGMQKSGSDFTDIDQQMNKVSSNRGKANINTIRRKVDNWLGRYKKIYVDSESPRKSASWKRILTRLGFKVKQDTISFMGMSQDKNFIEV